jgi:predicted nucleic acid-binding protein
VILADTSAWIDYLRRSGHPTALAMQRLAGADELVLTEPVIMELLAGARSDRHAAALSKVLAQHLIAPVEGVDTFQGAATIYRTCRRSGETIRNAINCLIAAVAIRAGASLLHNDRDFDVIARHTELEIHPVDP